MVRAGVAITAIIPIHIAEQAKASGQFLGFEDFNSFPQQQS